MILNKLDHVVLGLGYWFSGEIEISLVMKWAKTIPAGSPLGVSLLAMHTTDFTCRQNYVDL